MKCITCGADTSPGTTTDVTDLGGCLVIVRNVSCHKCSECNEIMYTADVIKRLEEIVKSAETAINEIAIVDYTKWHENFWEGLTPRELIGSATAGYSAPAGVQAV